MLKKCIKATLFSCKKRKQIQLVAFLDEKVYFISFFGKFPYDKLLSNNPQSLFIRREL